MNTDCLELSVKDQVATIALNRPEVSNALSIDTYGAVTQAVMDCEADDKVRVIVLTGKGKHFSAGGDIQRFKMLIETKQYLEEKNVLLAGKMAATVCRCAKPTIAMVNGAAAGAGCSLAMACDFRVVTPSTKLVMAFIKMGLSGDTGGYYYLQKLVGIAKATQLMMTGEQIRGTQACACGLATLLAEEGALEAETYRFAQQLVKGAGFAFARQKKLRAETFFADLEEYTAREAKYMCECSRTEDFAEAVNAFLEKRPPAFSGH